MADLETVKVILRSLVMSTKRSLSTYDLQRDFRQNEGYECPYVALGYRNFVAFLESIPDTIRILPGGMVTAVATEETQHIARLVALQKGPKSKPKRGGCSHGRSASYHRPPPRFQQSNSSYNSYRPQRSYSSSSYEASRTSSTYYSTGRNSNSGASSTYGSTTTSGATRTTRPKGPPVYSSSEKFFAKVREVKQKARAEELRSSHISRTPSPTEAGWSGEAFITDWGKQQAENAVEDSEPRRVNYCPAGYSSDGSDDSFYERFKDEGEHEVEPFKSKVPLANETVQPDPYFQSSDAISDPLKLNLKNLIKSYPDGLWACILPEKYQEKYGVNLQWNELGYDSLIQMVHDLQDVMICKRVQGGDWKLYDASLLVDNDADINDEATHETGCVSEIIKSRIFDVVKKYHSGIRCDQLVELYHESYSRSLLLDAPGFDSAENLFISIDGTVIRLRYIRQECYVLPGEPPLQTISEPAVAVSLDDKKQLGIYPSEVMGPKEVYTPLPLPDSIQPGNYIELRVAEVYNPFKLWIMLRDKSVELDKLMDELQDFYNDHGDKYLMPDTTIVEEQCCTTKYDDEWHRATIKSVGKLVQVFYVDYGTVASVSKKDLRFLHRDFTALPAQAILATLAGIQPPNGRQSFTREANEALLALVAEKHLIGLIQSVDPEKPQLELFLIDTTGDTDIHLNDVLVSQHHATFKPELLTTETKESHENAGQPKSEESIVQKSDLLDQPKTVASTAQSSDTVAPKPPPPGFGTTGQAQTPTAFPAGMPFYNGVNPGLNPMLNQTLPAYVSQMNAAILLQQQQQQQAYLLAYYQNLYQQSLLQLQSRMAAASSWMGSCQTNAYHPASAIASPANTHVYESPIKPQKETSETVKKYPEEKSQSISGTLSSHLDEITPSKPSEGIKQFRLSPMSDNSSSNSISDLVVKHLDEQGSDSSILSSASHCNVAPDLVQSVANMTFNNSSITNYWKVEEVCQQDVHIFNIDQKAYVSVGELARKFTIFSTSDSLLRVLKNKGIRPELKKVTRQDKLSLFSSLDGCPVEFQNSFDLSRNKNGNVVGTFNLCPLSNVPAVLIPLGTEVGIINGFRKLRDTFNPSEDYWMC